VDIVERIRSAIHLESAAIAPQTSALIEAARAGVAEIERYRSIATEYSRKSAEAEKTIERLRGAMPSTFTLEEPARAIEEREIEKSRIKALAIHELNYHRPERVLGVLKSARAVGIV
jgi:hypothetical protein